MREYNRVSPKFWTEAQVEGWSDEEKLLGVYLLTCEARTTEGLFRLTRETIAGDLDWPLETVTQTVSKLFAKRFLNYDETARVVFLPKALAYQRPENANQIKGAVKSILALPKTDLLPSFISAAKAHCPELAEALSERLRNRYPNGFETVTQTVSNTPTPTPAPTPTPYISSDSSEESDASDCTDIAIVDDAEIVDEDEESFAEFWDAYPRREGKKPARTAWRNIPKRDRPLAIGVARVMRRLVEQGAQDPRFVPHPTTFLHQQRWDDWRDGVPAGWRPEGDTRAARLNAVLAAACAEVEAERRGAS